jgi:hypothetical protein
MAELLRAALWRGVGNAFAPISNPAHKADGSAFLLLVVDGSPIFGAMFEAVGVFVLVLELFGVFGPLDL